MQSKIQAKLKKFSFIIPTNNRAALLEELLHSMIIQNFNPDFFEFLIIDNNGSDNSPEIVDSFKKNNPKFDIRYLKEKRQGVQYAWNKGIDEAKGKLLIFVDDDASFHKDYFENLEKDFENNLDNVAGGGKVAPVFEIQKPAWIYKYIMPYFAEINLGEKSKFPKKKHPFATNMLVSKNIFDIVGKFDTDKFNDKSVILPGTFEKDLFNRIRQEDFPVYYYYDLVVWHFIPQEKINKAYIKEQAIEIGKTYREIHAEKGILYSFIAFWKVFVKWLASVVLAVYYIFTTQWEKASMLYKVLWWRTKGFFSFSKK